MRIQDNIDNNDYCSRGEAAEYKEEISAEICNLEGTVGEHTQNFIHGDQAGEGQEETFH